MMKIKHKLRLQSVMQHSVFILLFLGVILLLGYVSSQFNYAHDLTQSQRNTLADASLTVLNKMQAPLNITVYAVADNASNRGRQRKNIDEFMFRFKRAKPNIQLQFVSPTEQPKLAQQAGIKVEGEMVVEYEQRSEHLMPPYTEVAMSNLLQRLLRSHEQAVMYLSTHGARDLSGQKKHDLGKFGQQLQQHGFKLANLDLRLMPTLSRNSSVLVLASPQQQLNASELEKIKDYIAAGGNLLWLLDGAQLHGLEPLVQMLGLEVSPGMVLDQSAAKYGADAQISFASRYHAHAITRDFSIRTVFAGARMIAAHGTRENGWQVRNLIEVAPNGWLEANPAEYTAHNAASAKFDPRHDQRGPINIALAMERKYAEKGQRIVVIANANFLDNSYITNSGNLDFGLRVVGWLAGDDEQITLPDTVLKDGNVDIPDAGWGQIFALLLFMPVFGFSFGLFQFMLPLALLTYGLWRWWQRRKA